MGLRTERQHVSAAMSGEADASAALLPLLDWVSRQPDEVDLELTCIEHPEPGRGSRGRIAVTLPGCLAQLPPHLLLELLVVGAASVTAAIGGCTASQVVRDRYLPLLALLDQLGHDDRLRLEDTSGRGRRRPVLSAASMPVSRRQLFFLSEAERRPLPDATATAHQRLVAAVHHLAGGTAHAAEAAIHVPDGPALQLTSQGCTACGVCVQACPEGALSIGLAAADDGAADAQAADRSSPVAETTLWMRASSCSGCRRCVDVCPVAALSECGHRDWADLLADGWVELETFGTVVCRRCGGRFPAGGGELCPVCAFRSAEPFATTLPPEVLARFGPEVARRLSGQVESR